MSQLDTAPPQTQTNGDETFEQLMQKPSGLSLGGLEMATPEDVLDTAIRVATRLAGVIKDRKLYKTISGRAHVFCEGWTTCAAMLGIAPREVSSIETDGSWEAIVELVRVSDGMVIGRASALCSTDESKWKSRDNFQRKSMATTRATSKACRLSLSWVMKLAGYEATPAEEMDGIKTDTKANGEPKASAQPTKVPIKDQL